MRLLDYASNTYSEYGEDGIIAKVLETLPTCDKWCVEFGAWDGQYSSNTCNLIDNAGYSAVLIEASKKRFRALVERYARNTKVIALNQFVGFGRTDGLDAILEKTSIPKDFDFLSIDIDGNDYHVWNAVASYHPKVVCIEFNPTIPTEVDFVQKADPRVNQGSSLSALNKLAKTKNYELVAVTATNAIFVQSEYFPMFHITANDPHTVRENVSCISHLFSGYDGTIFVTGSDRLPWHSIIYSERIRQLPRIFRVWTFGPMKYMLFRVYRKLCHLLHLG